MLILRANAEERSRRCTIVLLSNYWCTYSYLPETVSLCAEANTPHRLEIITVYRRYALRLINRQSQLMINILPLQSAAYKLETVDLYTHCVAFSSFSLFSFFFFFFAFFALSRIKVFSLKFIEFLENTICPFLSHFPLFFAERTNALRKIAESILALSRDFNRFGVFLFVRQRITTGCEHRSGLIPFAPSKSARDR